MQKLDTNYESVHAKFKSKWVEILNQDPNLRGLFIDDIFVQAAIISQTLMEIEMAQKINEIIDKTGGGA